MLQRERNGIINFKKQIGINVYILNDYDLRFQKDCFLSVSS